MFVPGIIDSYPAVPFPKNPTNTILDNNLNTLQNLAGFDISWKGLALPSEGSTVLLRLEESTDKPGSRDDTPNETGTSLFECSPTNQTNQPPTFNDSGLAVLTKRLGPFFPTTNQAPDIQSVGGTFPDDVDMTNGTVWCLTSHDYEDDIRGFDGFFNAGASPKVLWGLRQGATTTKWKMTLVATSAADGNYSIDTFEFDVVDRAPTLFALSRSPTGYSFYVSGVGVIAEDPATAGPTNGTSTFAWMKAVQDSASPIKACKMTIGGGEQSALYGFEMTNIVLSESDLDALSTFVTDTP